MQDESSKSKIHYREEEILKFWQKNKIFEKTLLGKDDEFTFYDGPPFATGLPHYGHILAGTIKDAIPRYKTMQGFKVKRRWGWDCHGLPVENLVEKELGLKTRKDIEIFGIEKFNEVARGSVMRYADEWRKIVPRLGRFVDMENDYRTMDSSYTESVWWAFKDLHKKGLIYEGFKSMHICPRCETTLSNFEVTQGYKDVTDISVYAKFKLKDEENTFIVAWTTTPWTLPGNVALAVGKDIIYSKIKIEDKNEFFIIAKDRIEKSAKDGNYKIVEEIKGSDLIGKKYEPLFDYYSNDPKLKNRENGWKICAGDFVTTEDGTGIVHIAPAFGDDDYKLSIKENLPFVQHVGMNGVFKEEVRDFSGRQVKPKEKPEETDIEILKNLAGRGLLFAKEKFTHSYPHCWRCDTPLLNYATSSWFVKVTDIKSKLVKENQKVSWIPEEIGKYRFGNWLEDARDWAISRSRFWGAPIPVWKCEKCGKIEVCGGKNDIQKPSRNNFTAIRHGEALNNVLRVTSSLAETPHGLTEKGIEQVKESSQDLKSKKIDYIFYSPLQRTKETANILKEQLGLKDEAFIEDDRLREVGHGKWEGKSVDEYRNAVGKDWETLRFDVETDGVESYNSIRRRVGEFLLDIDKKYKGKNILIVSHDVLIWLMESVALGASSKDAVLMRGDGDTGLKNAEIREIEFSYFPRNKNFELDFHRPYIDDVILSCKCGGSMKRVPEVFDCWFESGAMPFASNNYPHSSSKETGFEPNSGFFKKSKGYPAEFIAEGVDQTRGWFYSMMVLGVALFDKSPYENVIVNGIILAENGEKMSKRLKNYPDPMYLVEKYGADALRYYLLSSPVVKSEDVRFSEKGVDEVSKKVLTRLDNVLSFYNLYKDIVHTLPKGGESPKELDIWIKARLGEITESITKSMDKYELDKATRPIADFVDDLSVWYLRRSRERFKGDDDMDKRYALATLRFVLFEFSKLMAPIMPFMAEYIYQSLLTTDYLLSTNSSVHLEAWPVSLVDYFHKDKIKDMQTVRDIVSKALESRAKANVKVRQPLLLLRIKNKELGIKEKEELVQLIKDEVNVKKVIFDEKLSTDVELDTNITEELKEEGRVRDIVRLIQELRKERGLTIKDFVDLVLETNEEGRTVVEKNKTYIIKNTLLRSIAFSSNLSTEEILIGDNLSFKMDLIK
jgi:isoleucyl-tRNA synthetase